MYGNTLTYRVWGEYALFTDPVVRAGGEKSTLTVPTYQSLKGIVESCYWKPSIIWYIDRVKIMKPILTESKGIRPIKYGGGNDLSYYTYLRDVSYIVEAHFEFNENRKDLVTDRNVKKHAQMAERSLRKGGRRDVFLGTRECQAYIEPSSFDVEGYYSREMDLGLMYHSIQYPDESVDGKRYVRFWYPKMVDSVIEFCRPEECPISRELPGGSIKTFNLGENIKAVEEEIGEAVDL
ncbi:MAG: type I-C CRISPR-associated protein Cas5 [Clostridiaceae bacterium]|nr:type I-C CRISPR-associated protein Cas5 [Clostridiaceae bacterium]